MPILEFPIKDLAVQNVTVYGESVPSGVATKSGAWIRRVAGDPTRYARDGVLLNAAYFETIHVPMSALTEVFGLDLSVNYRRATTNPELGVGLQVSLDGGVTFLAWTGAAWVSQVLSGTYNSRETFDEHCATLAILNPKKIGFRIKLSREADSDDTPMLLGLRAYVEWKYDAHLDVYDTLKALSETELQIPVLRYVDLPAASATFVLNDEYNIVASGEFKIYNLTTDPNRNLNKFQGFNSGTKVVTLSAVQAMNSRLEVHFKGNCKVIIVRQDEMVNISILPITVIRLDNRKAVEGTNTGRSFDYKIGTTTRRVRIRQHPVAREVSIQAEHWSRSPREALLSVDAMRSVFSSSFRLKATGETPAFIEEEQGKLEDMPSESFYVGVAGGQLRLYFHSQYYTEYQGVSRIRFAVGTMTKSWTTDQFVVGEETS